MTLAETRFKKETLHRLSSTLPPTWQSGATTATKQAEIIS